MAGGALRAAVIDAADGEAAVDGTRLDLSRVLSLSLRIQGLGFRD